MILTLINWKKSIGIFLKSFFVSFFIFSNIFGTVTVFHEGISYIRQNSTQVSNIPNGYCFFTTEQFKEHLVLNKVNLEKVTFVEDLDITFKEKFINKCAGRVTGISELNIYSESLQVFYVPGNNKIIYDLIPIFSILFFSIFIIFVIFFRRFENQLKKINFSAFFYLIIIFLYLFRSVNVNQNILDDLVYILGPTQNNYSLLSYSLIFISAFVMLNTRYFSMFFGILFYLLFAGTVYKLLYFVNLNIYFLLFLTIALFYIIFYSDLKRTLVLLVAKLNIELYEKIFLSAFFSYINIYILNRGSECIDTDCKIYHYTIPKLIQNNLPIKYEYFAEIGYGLSQAYTNLYSFTIGFFQQITSIDYLIVGHIFQAYLIYMFLLIMLVISKQLDIKRYLPIFLLIFLSYPTFIIYVSPGNYMFLLTVLLLLRVSLISHNIRSKYLLDFFILMIGPIGVLSFVIFAIFEFKNQKQSFFVGISWGIIVLINNFFNSVPFLYPYTDVFLTKANKYLYSSTTKHLSLNNSEAWDSYNLTSHNIFFGHPRIFPFGLIALALIVYFIFKVIKYKRIDKQILFILIYTITYSSVLVILGYKFDRYYFFTNIVVTILIFYIFNKILNLYFEGKLSQYILISVFFLTSLTPTYNLFKAQYYYTEEMPLLYFGSFDKFSENNLSKISEKNYIRDNYSFLSSQIVNKLEKNDYQTTYGDLRILDLEDYRDTNLLFSEVSYLSYEKSISIWDAIEDLNTDFSIIPYWVYTQEYLWPVLSENNFYVPLNEDKLYTFYFCNEEFEAFMLIDHNNKFSDLLEKSLIEEFCWYKKPMTTYEKAINN